MTIVKMRLKGTQIHIHTSTGYVFSVPKNGISGLDIYEGLDIEDDDPTSIKIRAYESSACKAAVNILAGGFLSEGMLKEKLKTKGHKNRFIRYALKYCREYDLIDDKRFTKIAVTSLKFKGKSKMAIINYLKKSKIKASLIERASRMVSERNEINTLKKSIKKYYPVYKDRNKCEDLLIKSLVRKGFNYNSVNTLVRKYVRKQNIPHRGNV